MTALKWMQWCGNHAQMNMSEMGSRHAGHMVIIVVSGRPAVVGLLESMNVRGNISQMCDPYLNCAPAEIMSGFIQLQTETKPGETGNWLGWQFSLLT